MTPVSYAQELPSSCVAACLRMAFSAFGLNCLEAEVRNLIGSSPLGVSLARAHARLVEAGATAELHDDWNLDDLRDASRSGLTPIVGVERYPLGYARAFHAIVLIKIHRMEITALDPLVGPQPRTYSVAAFGLAWEMGGREALLIEEPPPSM
jgi:ABC-type bacteriocin/lantibiotic exporter with double-glycine peptidase domain